MYYGNDMRAEMDIDSKDLDEQTIEKLNLMFQGGIQSLENDIGMLAGMPRLIEIFAKIEQDALKTKIKVIESVLGAV